MRVRKILVPLTVVVIMAGAAGAAVLTHDQWRPQFDAWRDQLSAGQKPSEPAGEHAHADEGQVELSPQAQKNLGVDVRRLKLATEPFRPTVRVPGTIVERPGRSDHTVTAPVAGVVKRVACVPGDVVRPGDVLFTLRLNGEGLQNAQTELFKTARELEINRRQRERLAAAAQSGAVAQARLMDLDYQQERLEASRLAYRNDLTARGLAAADLVRVERGEFVTEFAVRVPEPAPPAVASHSHAPGGHDHDHSRAEVEELRVSLGQQVQPGSVLALLAHHSHLAVEGHLFPHEVPLLRQALERGWPVRVEVPGEADGDWGTPPQDLQIAYVANTADAGGQTLPFYVPLPNQSREYSDAGKPRRLWRYRPGVRVRLGVPVRELRDVFVLPAAAVARDGPEAYVFRQSGDVFVRKPVRVLYEDREHVVLDPADSDVREGNFVAHNAAAALNRALKAKASEGGGGHGHDHHGHSH